MDASVMLMRSKWVGDDGLRCPHDRIATKDGGP